MANLGTSSNSVEVSELRAFLDYFMLRREMMFSSPLGGIVKPRPAPCVNGMVGLSLGHPS